MLANFSDNLAYSGALGSDVQMPDTSRHALLDFIADELPKWRDRADRKPETSETVLTSQLCAHLNSASRHSSGWDILQFRCEVADEHQKGRKIDLVPSPCGTAIWIEGRRYSDFDTILPIECKRLPTPKDTNRDEREYVVNGLASTGGIQRFKEGNHGAGHALAAMIGYIQEETIAIWKDRITEWIEGLVAKAQSGWSSDDKLVFEREDETLKLAVLSSSHHRSAGSTDIQLRHLWLEMN